MLRGKVWAVVLMIWVLGACQKKSEEPIAEAGGALKPEVQKPLGQQTEPTNPAEKITEQNPSVPSAAGPELKLLDSGSEPKKQLRYKFKVGARDTMIMDLKLTMAMSLGTIKQPETVLPTVRTTMDIQSKEISADGNLRYEFKIVDSEVLEEAGTPLEVMSAMKEEAGRTKGLSGWAVVTDRGYTKEAEIVVPDNASSQLKQMVNNMRSQIRTMSSPFPEEPVGIGAKWQLKVPVISEAVTIEQIATYQLQEEKGDHGKLQMELTQDAKPQKIQTADMQPGTQAMLNSLKSSGSGTMLYNLNKLIPNSEMKMKMSMDMTVEGGGEKQAVTMDTSIQVAVRSKN